MPTFLPLCPTKEEITTIDIEACYQEYQTLIWDIRERYYFQEYIFKYGFMNKKENANSLRNNQQPTSMEETKESPSSVGGEVEKVLHQEDQKTLLSDFEKYEETS